MSHSQDKVKFYCINSFLVHGIVSCSAVVIMAKIQFLTILLTFTCFLGGVASVTDKEFEVYIEPMLNILFNWCRSKYFKKLIDLLID